MGALINQTDIGRAVFSLVREDTGAAVSARSLAQRLHVSVGALYNYAGSMQGALHAGETFIEAQLRDEFGVTDLSQLVAIAEGERAATEFVFDPHRLHAEASPWLSSLLARGLHIDGTAVFEPLNEGVPVDDLFIEGCRNMVGRLLVDQQQLSVARALLHIPANWPRHFASAIADARANPQPQVDLRDVNIAEELLDLAIRFVQGSNLPERQTRVRCASLTLLLTEGEAVWKFRALSNLSGIPLAALHNLGSRKDHLRASLNDVVVALYQIALRDADDDDDAMEAYRRLPYLMVSASETLLGNFSTVAVPSVISQLDVVTARERPEAGTVGVRTMTLTAGYSILMSAWLSRDRDPQGWALAPQIAVDFIERATADRMAIGANSLTS